MRRRISACEGQQVVKLAQHLPRGSINVSRQPLRVRHGKALGIDQQFGPAVDGGKRIAKIVNNGTGDAAQRVDPFLPDQLVPPFRMDADIALKVRPSLPISSSPSRGTR